MRFFFLFFLSFLLLTSVVTAVGVSPAMYEVEFIPGLEKEFSFFVKNNIGQDIHVNVGASGALREFVTVPSEPVFAPVNQLTEFKVQLRLPEEIETPGKNIIKVTIVEDIGGDGISARTGVIPIIVVHVPYPGRYAEITSLEVGGNKGGINEGGNASVKFIVVNRGKEDLLGTSARVTLSDNDGVVLRERSFENMDIPVGLQGTQSFVFDTEELTAGSYNVDLEYYYDNITRKKSARLLIGYLDVDINRFPKEVQKHGIALVPFYIQNRWGSSVVVSASLAVDDVQTARTADIKIEPFDSGYAQVYLDTSRLLLGNQSGFVVLEFEQIVKSNNPLDALNKELTKRIPVNFTLVEPYDAAPVVEERPSLLSNTTALYGILLTLLLLLGAAGVILFQTLHKSQSKK